MSKVIKCDRCGAEIEEGNLGYVSMLKRDPEGDLCGDNPFEKMDFCPDCMDKIAKYVSEAQRTTVKAAKPPQKKRRDLQPNRGPRRSTPARSGRWPRPDGLMTA